MINASPHRQRKLFFLKTLALLSIVRWKNIVVTALAQYLAALFTLNPGRPKLDILLDLNLHLIVLATALTIAAGYIINNFYDVEKDFINRPAKTKFQRIISSSFVLKLYFLLNVSAFIIAFLASWRVFIFFLSFAITLWFYSHKLRKYTLVKEIVASMLSVTAWFSVSLYYSHMTPQIFLFGVYVVGLLFMRELIKDLSSIKGDLAVGNQTIPIVWGIKWSKKIMVVLSILAISILLYLLAVHPSMHWYILFTCSFLLFILINTSILQTSATSKQLHWLYRILIFLAIWGVALV